MLRREKPDLFNYNSINIDINYRRTIIIIIIILLLIYSICLLFFSLSLLL